MTTHTNEAAATVTYTNRAFGIELETIGANRKACADIIAVALGLDINAVRFVGGHYDRYTVELTDGRKWTCMTDGSLSTSLSCEVVSPILTTADMPMLRIICEALKAAGVGVDGSCGMHVHVDARDFTGANVVCVAKLAHKYSNLYLAGLGVDEARKSSRWVTNGVRNMTHFLKSSKPSMTKDEAARCWYMTRSTREVEANTREHYNQSRYNGVNLHAVWFKGTVEFRHFAGTLDFATIEESVFLVKGLVEMACRYSRVSGAQVPSDCKKTWKWLVKWTGVPASVASRLIARFPETPAALPVAAQLHLHGGETPTPYQHLHRPSRPRCNPTPATPVATQPQPTVPSLAHLLQRNLSP